MNHKKLNKIFKRNYQASSGAMSDDSDAYEPSQWVSTTLNPHTAVGTTLATKTVANIMIGNSDTVGVQQISRMLLVRAWLREHDERRSQPAKPKQLTTSKPKKNQKDQDSNTSNKRKRMKDNFDSAPKDRADENEEVEEESEDVQAFWTDLNSWLNVKMEGKKAKHGGKSISGLGNSFKTPEWSKYYMDLVTNELTLFPDDTIPLIPRQTAPELRPVNPEPSAMFSTPAARSYVAQLGSNGNGMVYIMKIVLRLKVYFSGMPQMSLGSHSRTGTPPTPLGFRSDSPLGPLFATAGGSQLNHAGMSYANQNFGLIAGSHSQTRFEPQETSGARQDTSHQWTRQHTCAPAGLQGLLQNGFQASDSEKLAASKGRSFIERAVIGSNSTYFFRVMGNKYLTKTRQKSKRKPSEKQEESRHAATAAATASRSRNAALTSSHRMNQNQPDTSQMRQTRQMGSKARRNINSAKENELPHTEKTSTHLSQPKSNNISPSMTIQPQKVTVKSPSLEKALRKLASAQRQIRRLKSRNKELQSELVKVWNEAKAYQKQSIWLECQAQGLLRDRKVERQKFWEHSMEIKKKGYIQSED
ncbi:hypothetical protein BT96DRAFT_989766 [Gymnopus androsaceus JB14]|uniref:Uncharacterized protein n=1 Tax=Gymnopus androsaceus JB14 TaxID=1447944 RepID=A0A6A4I3Q5_9AGAR|nr:hypothetical protein BT96DRAFT_989766 [Gymnopus androsaceus JB14]